MPTAAAYAFLKYRTQLLVLLGCVMLAAINVSTLFNSSLTVFIKPIAAETGWSRGQLSLSSTAMLGACFVMLPFVGKLGDRFGPRKLILCGAPLYALGLTTIGLMPASLPLHLVACALVGAAGATTFAPVYIGLLSGFFRGRLGLAVGILSAGAGIGTVIMPLASQFLISSLGWRSAYFGLSAAVLTISLFSAIFLLRERPAPRAEKAHKSAPTNGTAFMLWRAAISYLLISVAIGGMLVHLVPLLTDRGMDATTAAFYTSFLGLGSLLSRICVGYLLDYFDAGRIGGIGFLLGAMGILVLAGNPGPVATTVSIFLIGSALGTETDVLPFVTRCLSGAQAYITMMSRMSMALVGGALIGPVTAGVVFDLFNNYTHALYGFAAASFVAAILHLSLARALAIARQAEFPARNRKRENRSSIAKAS